MTEPANIPVRRQVGGKWTTVMITRSEWEEHEGARVASKGGNVLVVNGVRYPVINAYVEVEAGDGRRRWGIVTEGEEQPVRAEATPEGYEKFVAGATPCEPGFVIQVFRVPHPAGHVPVAFTTLYVPTWDPAAADELLLRDYRFEPFPGSEWEETAMDVRGRLFMRAKNWDQR